MPPTQIDYSSLPPWLIAMCVVLVQAVIHYYSLRRERNKNSTDRDTALLPQAIKSLENAYNNQFNDARERIKRLEAKIEQSNKNNDEMIAKVAILEDKVKGLEKVRSSLEYENSIVKGGLSDLKFKYAELEGEHNKLKRNYKHVKDLYINATGKVVKWLN